MSEKTTDRISNGNINEELQEPYIGKSLLNPRDRISEILYGLIMALTFTCTFSVIKSDRAEVDDMLIGAIGCNIAWGLVDAVMFLIFTMTEKARGVEIYNFIKESESKDKSLQFISDSLPPVISKTMKSEDLEKIRLKLLNLPVSPNALKLVGNDYKTAIGILLLVFLSTFPVALPFVFIADLQTALRVSNLIAIIMMFMCGWFLGRFAGRNRFMMGLLLSILGISLVLITISLGG